MIHTQRGFGGPGKARNSTELENGVKVEMPTKDQVRLWVKQDINASSYFLSMLLRYPDLVDKIADEFYERIVSEEQGALIDHINKAQS